MTTIFISISLSDSSAHRSGCHRWYTCHSDTGSYTYVPKYEKFEDDEKPKYDRCPNGYNKNDEGICEKKKDNNLNENIFGFKEDDYLYDYESQLDSTNNNYFNIFPEAYYSPEYESDSHESSLSLYGESSKSSSEFTGIITKVVNGELIHIDTKPIHLSLVDAPEKGEKGFKKATKFVIKNCLNKMGIINKDNNIKYENNDGIVEAIVYCEGININKLLLEKGYAIIDKRYCDVSNFYNIDWVKAYC